MTAFYNEIDPYAAQWLRNLIAAGHIAPGVVDERSITEIDPDELRGFTQCHFFAGIGVWSHALRRAGWADDRPVWTGSCPCQPFSAAGKQAGFDDARHLWPTWFRLIAECRPAIVLGEQVASALEWVDLVSADLEGASYAFGASDLCAAGFGGAHIRQRLYFVALADGDRRGRDQAGRDTACNRETDAGQARDWLGYGRAHGFAAGLVGVAELRGEGRRQERADAARRGERSRAPGLDERSGAGGALRWMGDARSARTGGHPGGACGTQEEGEGAWVPDGHRGRDARGAAGATGRPGAPLLGRHAADWLQCRDGKWRPVEPGTFPLADAVAGRVGRLRAYGNGLDAETATQFCSAVGEALIDVGLAA